MVTGTLPCLGVFRGDGLDLGDGRRPRWFSGRGGAPPGAGESPGCQVASRDTLACFIQGGPLTASSRASASLTLV